MIDYERREFFKHLAALTGTVVIAPMALGCASANPKESTVRPIARVDASGAPPIPEVKPDNWDPIVFNRDRGLKGAIPASYYKDINGPDGEKAHLGKHLPYIPPLKATDFPQGYIPIMWGDPAKGYTQHPSAPKFSEGYPIGHWYNWVRIKGSAAGSQEVESQFDAWPGAAADRDATVFATFGGGDITANSGKNTIYMLNRPGNINEGDTLRIHGHCLYHGECVDFIEFRLA